jgi:hypothetical protein
MRAVVKVLGCEDLNWFYAIHVHAVIDKYIQQYQQNANIDT